MLWTTAWTTFLLSLSLSADDMVVGVSYGLRRTLLRPAPLALIVLGSTLSMTLSMLLGKLLTAGLHHSVTRYLSVALLGGLGLWTLYKAWKESRSEPQARPGARRLLRAVGLWESFYLGLALGVDDFAEAFGLAVAGFPVALTVVLFKVSEVLMICTGELLGYLGLARLAGHLAYVPGVTLFLVGLWQLA
jgi:putative Mn2+ efflux pump MntP